MADHADDQRDRMLPIANVGRVMKQSLPPWAKISKDAKQTMRECSTEFISFVTSEASDKCHKENRKTLNGDDICWALRALGFDNYAQVMLRYLCRYREAERDKANYQISSNNNNNNNNSPNPSTSSPDNQYLSILDHQHKDGSDCCAQPVGEEKSSAEISTGRGASANNLMEFEIMGDQHHNKSLVKSS